MYSQKYVETEILRVIAMILKMVDGQSDWKKSRSGKSIGRFIYKNENVLATWSIDIFFLQYVAF